MAFRLTLEECARDPETAVAAIEGAPELFPAQDASFVEWLVTQRPSQFGDGVRRAYERALEGPREVRRFVHHPLGAHAWYSGRPADAEQHWTRGMMEGDRLRDEHWRRSLNSISLIKAYRGRVFESLVLCGLCLRHTPKDEFRRSRVFTGTQRARALLRLEQFEAAQAQIEQSVHDAERVEIESERAESNELVCSLLSHWHALHGRWREALAESRRYLDTFSGPPAVLAATEIACLEARYEIGEEDPETILEELATVPDRFQVSGQWLRTWRSGLHFMRWRRASELGDLATSETEARKVLELLDGDLGSTRLERPFEYLANLPLSEDIHRAFSDLAVNAILNRIVVSLEERQVMFERDDVTEEDWQALWSYQQRLFDPPHDLRSALAELWRPGLEAYDKLDSGFFLVSCAWCGCLRSKDGRWVVSEDLAPLVTTGRLSHGICEDCSGKRFV